MTPIMAQKWQGRLFPVLVAQPQSQGSSVRFPAGHFIKKRKIPARPAWRHLHRTLLGSS